MSSGHDEAQRVGPRYPHLVMLFGATGDLSQRKLLPGLFHLASSGFIPGYRIVGVSLDEMDAEGFRQLARKALTEFAQRPVTDEAWATFAANLDYVPLSAGPAALKAAAERAEQSFSGESRRLHYLSVPPNAALAAARALGEANLVERSRIVMEKPFGTDLASAQALNASLHEVSASSKSSASIIFWARSRRRTSWRSALPTACSSRFGIATSSITCKSTCRRRSVAADAPRFTSGWARFATWS